MNPHPGLCANCRHARVIENRRGSRFHLCRLGVDNPDYAKYPRLPVTYCQGYEPNRESYRNPKDSKQV